MFHIGNKKDSMVKEILEDFENKQKKKHPAGQSAVNPAPIALSVAKEPPATVQKRSKSAAGLEEVRFPYAI
jgi:hypothetical protein